MKGALFSVLFFLVAGFLLHKAEIIRIAKGSRFLMFQTKIKSLFRR